MFPILLVNEQLGDEYKGTKEKYWSTINEKKCLIKFNRYDKQSMYDINSYNVSEKIYSEIAKFLDIPCVSTDFVIDTNGRYGIASYDYKESSMNFITSGDDLFASVFGRFPKKRGDNIDSSDYTYENIIRILLKYDSTGNLLKKFNRMLVLDVFLGEQDRHHENWGIYNCIDDNEKYYLLPLYDNSACLLHQFRNKSFLEKNINCNMEKYIKQSKCKIAVNGTKLTHFKFIDYLLDNLPDEYKDDIKETIKKIGTIDEKYINNLLNKIPNDLCCLEHKKLINNFIILRRNELLLREDA